MTQTPPTHRSPTHWAIAIGIGHYPLLPPLPYAEADALALAQAWTDRPDLGGSNCLLLSDRSAPALGRPTYPNRDNLEYWLDRVCGELIQPGDLLWVFFNGYGAATGGAGQEKDFLLPVEADRDRIAAAGLPLEKVYQTLQKAVQRAGEGSVLLLLDVNQLEGAQGWGSQTRRLAESSQIPTILSWAAGQRSQVSATAGGGVFGLSLVQALRHPSLGNLYALERSLRENMAALCQGGGGSLAEPDRLSPQEPVVLVHPANRLYQTVLRSSGNAANESYVSFPRTASPSSPPGDALAVAGAAAGSAVTGQPAVDAAEGPAPGAWGLELPEFPDLPPAPPLESSPPGWPPSAATTGEDEWAAIDFRAPGSSATREDSPVPPAPPEGDRPPGRHEWEAVGPTPFDSLPASEFPEAVGTVSPWDQDPAGGGLPPQPPVSDPPIQQGPGGGALPAKRPQRDPLFTRNLVTIGLLGMLALLAGVGIRNCTEIAGQQPETSSPPDASPSVSLDEALPLPVPPPTSTPTGPAVPVPPPPTAAASVPPTAPPPTPPAPAATTAPADPNRLLQEARAALDRGQAEPALAALNRLPAGSKTSPEATTLINRARQLRSGGILSDARLPLGDNQASEFKRAIERARQLKPGDPLYAEAQQDITRWSQVMLDLARGRALKGDYGGAIAAAEIVPRDRPEVYNAAQAAIPTWKTRQQQQAATRKTLAEASKVLKPGQASSYNRAIDLARAVKPDQDGYPLAQEQINTWSQEILKLAQARAKAKQMAQAIATARLVPPNTAAYAAAQTALAQWKTP